MLISHVTLEGGLRYHGEGAWTKTNSARTELHREGDAEVIDDADDVEVLAAVRAAETTNWRLQDLFITTTSATLSPSSTRGVSTYGVHVLDSSFFSITRCDIRPGDASDGADGAGGAGGSSGDNGISGAQGTEYDPHTHTHTHTHTPRTAMLVRS